MNTFEFFKNYKIFSNHIRYVTSKILLAQLKTTKDIELQKVVMLRIVEELVSSTEDLSMWLISIHSRNDRNPIFRDEWERLLMLEINKEDAKKILSRYRRLKTTNGFLKKMDFPSVKQIANKLATDEELLTGAVKVVLTTINSAFDTRVNKDGIVVRFHNKMKHGMMVYTDLERKISWIRDFSVKRSGKKKRISRTDRGFNIPIDLDKAERIVGTIKSNSYGIEALINLLLIDYEYRFTTSKIRLRKQNREKYLAEVAKALKA